MRPFLFVSFFVSACLQIGGDTQRLVESNSAEIEAGTAYDIEIEPPLELPGHVLLQPCFDIHWVRLENEKTGLTGL